MGATFAQIASAGPLLLAVGVALIAGLVSFLSPCVLPLVPGYLSYVTGLAGADLDAALGDRDGPPGAGPGGAGPGGAGPGGAGPGGAGVAVAVAPVAVARGRGGRRRVLA
ncbi:MAG TPA: cytochrome c biogenesis protein CcdA, partial [Catenuloplanes sp.]